MPIAVDTKHPEYERRLPQWQRQRDVVEGEDAVKAAGQKYLPKLKGHERTGGAADYERYKTRACFLNATSRTVQGFTGMVLRKTPDLNWVGDEKALETIGSSGESLDEILAQTLDELVGIGRYGLLVDAASEVDADPFIALYTAESIQDWDEELIDGRRIPVMVKLRETETTRDVVGEYKNTEVIRKLRADFPENIQPSTVEEEEILDKTGIEGLLAHYGLALSDFNEGNELTYFVEKWVEQRTETGTSGKTFIRSMIVVPAMRGGRRMNRIPFTFLNPNDTKPDPSAPPLMDLALVNLSHYRNSADEEHGLHFTALPQPYITGAPAKQTDLVIGSAVAWLIDEDKARVGMLEFTGAGMGALREKMEAKKREMATLGARLLEQPKAAVESAQAMQMRAAGERSALARMAMAASEAFTNVLQIVAEWMGAQGFASVSIALNMDFDNIVAEPQFLAQLLAKVQTGTMSWSSYFWNLKRFELIPDNVTEEEEAARILAGMPGGSELETEESEELVTTGAGPNGHTHTYGSDDSNTSTDDEHSHSIERAQDGTVTIKPAVSPGADSTHTHTPVGD